MKRILLIPIGVLALGALAFAGYSVRRASAKPSLATAAAPASASAPMATATAMPGASARAQRASRSSAKPVATEVNFLSACRYSRSAPNDPIVYPNMPGASHSHDFFANVTTAADSTLESLRAGGTTCRRSGDTAAYWAPSLYVDGTQVAPVSVNAYYRTGGKDPATIQAPPAGLKIVAGNHDSAGPQDPRITSFLCADVPVSSSSTAVPTCPNAGANSLRIRVRFPDCWNGKDLDSADHKSHMAYSVRGACPAGYPVPIAQLTLSIRYPTTGGPGVTLASGPFYTAHADFFNGWDQTQLESLVKDCLNAKVHCGGKGTGQ